MRVVQAMKRVFETPQAPDPAGGAPEPTDSGRSDLSEDGAKCPDRHEHRVDCEIELPTTVGEGFDLWYRLERLPEILDSVRRVKRIGPDQVLWDVDVAGRQLLWEAQLTEIRPGRRIAWESRSGVPNRGVLRFEPIDEDEDGAGSRMKVEIVYEPRGWLEGIGARLGLVQRSVELDLERFRRFVTDRAQRRLDASRVPARSSRLARSS